MSRDVSSVPSTVSANALLFALSFHLGVQAAQTRVAASVYVDARGPVQSADVPSVAASTFWIPLWDWGTDWRTQAVALTW